MEIVLFDNYDVFAEALIKLAKNAEQTSVIICNYKDAVGMIQALVEQQKLTIESVDITDPEVNGYDKEYHVAVTKDMELWVEPAFRDGHYLKSSADIVFVTGNSNSKAIKDIDSESCYETYIGELPEELLEEVEEVKEENTEKDETKKTERTIDDVMNDLSLVVECIKFLFD
jgi:hypothetical protein